MFDVFFQIINTFYKYHFLIIILLMYFYIHPHTIGINKYLCTYFFEIAFFRTLSSSRELINFYIEKSEKKKKT